MSEIAAIEPAHKVESRPDFLGPYVAPTTYFEKRLATIWQRETGLDRIGVDDSYFDIDGDSLTAVAIFESLRAETGVDLPPSTIVEKPTIRELALEAARVLVTGKSDPVIGLNEGGGRPPIVIPHGLGGHVIFARDFADRFGPDQPIYGIRGSNQLFAKNHKATMFSLAEEYTAGLLARRPKGPFILCGYSIGGAFALEIAHELRRRGHEVPLVVAIDAFTMLTKNPAGSAKFWSAVARRSFRERGVFVALGRATRRMLRKAKAKATVGAGHEVDLGGDGDALDPVMKAAINRASWGYDGTPYDGAILSIAARSTQEWTGTDDLGWRRIARGRLDIEVVDCRHRDIIQPPHLDRLVEIIGRYIG